MAIKRIEFILAEKIQYHMNGDLAFTDRIVMTAPTSNMQDDAFALKQLCQRALISLSSKISSEDKKKAQEEDKNNPSKGEEVTDFMSMFYASDLDIQLILKAFKKLAKGGVVTLDEKIVITDAHFDHIDLEDIEELANLYLGNFIMRSRKSK